MKRTMRRKRRGDSKRKTQGGERKKNTTYIAAQGAEEMADVPVRAAREHDLALDRRGAALAARAEGLVEVEVAVEAEAFIIVIVIVIVVVIVVRASFQTCLPPLLGLREEGDAFEPRAAVEAREALRVETRAGGADDAAGDGERAVRAQGGCASHGGGLVRGCGGVVWRRLFGCAEEGVGGLWETPLDAGCAGSSRV